MREYQELLKDILTYGNDRGDRTGTGTRSCFGLQFRHDLSKGFPLLTTKKMAWKPIVIELLWFLRGDTNIRYLIDNGCHIWTADAHRVFRNNEHPSHVAYDDVNKFEQLILTNEEFAAKWGDLGPVYGRQWRKWAAPRTDEVTNDYIPNFIDQIKNVIESISKNPEGRRHIVTAWNPAEVDRMALPPCHVIFQFYINNNKLSCHMYQRSADTFLGVPFNIASYALLTHIIAAQCSLDVGELIISFGDIHIYNNHKEQVAEQLTRTPRVLPKLAIVGRGHQIDEYKLGDFILDNYNPYPAIKGDLSVGI